MVGIGKMCNYLDSVSGCSNTSNHRFNGQNSQVNAEYLLFKYLQCIYNSSMFNDFFSEKLFLSYKVYYVSGAYHLRRFERELKIEGVFREGL